MSETIVPTARDVEEWACVSASVCVCVFCADDDVLEVCADKGLMIPTGLDAAAVLDADVTGTDVDCCPALVE